MNFSLKALITALVGAGVAYGVSKGFFAADNASAITNAVMVLLGAFLFERPVKPTPTAPKA